MTVAIQQTSTSMNSPSTTSSTSSKPATAEPQQLHTDADNLLARIAFRNRQIKELEAGNNEDKEALQGLYDASLIPEKYSHPDLPIKATLKAYNRVVYSDSCQDSIAKLKEFDVIEGLTTTKTTYSWTITERKETIK